jgi:hypothetical protein
LTDCELFNVTWTSLKIDLPSRLIKDAIAVIDAKKINCLNLVVNFLVLGFTFFLSCLLLSVGAEGDLFLQTVFYAATLVAFVCLTNWIAMRDNTVMNSLTRKIFSNAVGIMIGTCVILVFENLFATGSDFIAAVIFSGVTAFFILGTLAPLIVCKSSSLNNSHTYSNRAFTAR